MSAIDLAAKPGAVKRVHVDRRIIARNHKTGEREPPITVQTSAGPLKAMEVVIHGPSTFVYSPEKPLKCGARLWIETTAALSLTGVQP